MPDLRKPFIVELTLLADDRTAFITCDVGFSFLEPLADRLGDRFLNLGVTEPHAMAAAAGMAKEGMKVYIYSMINFMAFRPYEALRNLVACGNLDVNVLAVSGSAAYAFLGWSHNMILPDEDVKVLDHLPNLKIQIPTEEHEAKYFASKTFKDSNPTYTRL